MRKPYCQDEVKLAASSMRGYCQRLRRAALDRRMFAPVSGRQGTTRENAIVLVRLMRLRIEVQMLSANLIDLPRSCGCAGEYRNHSSLARLYLGAGSRLSATSR
jgi:hypothetical protein